MMPKHVSRHDLHAWIEIDGSRVRMRMEKRVENVAFFFDRALNCALIEIMARCVIDLSVVWIPRETRISMLIIVERINRIFERDGTICNKEERSRCSRYAWTQHNTVKVQV